MSHKSLAATLVIFIAATLTAQQQGVPIVLTKVAGDVYVATGGTGSNSGVIIGPTSVILVDTKTSVDSEKDVLTAIARVTPKPVTAVFLTHSDGDHVNGVAALPKGIQVIAHENCRKEMESAIAASGRGTPAAETLPNRVTTKEREDFVIDGIRFSGFHWGPAHTSGDLVVLMPDQHIAFGGDILATNRPDPIIHAEKNGSSEGWISTVAKIASLDASTFVPGHGELQTKEDVRKRLAAVQEKRSKIASLVAQGKSLDEVRQSLNETPAVQAPGGRGGLATFTEVVYQELTHK
jgi:glyoxylase-like metal-dependent hydrolase (beta-lactamase superfamily II)